MTNASILAVYAVALRMLSDEVTDRLAAVKHDLAGQLDPGDTKAARLADGTKVGRVTYTGGGKATARVVDERALTAWVAQHYPDQLGQHVQPWFIKEILDASAEAGVPMAPDGTAEVPGVQLRTSNPYLTVTPDRAQRAAITDYVRAQLELVLDGGSKPLPEGGGGE